MLKCLSNTIMSLSPETLLSNASRDRCIANLKELPPFVKGKNFKYNASVLVPLCIHKGDVSLLYTLRALNLNNHSGQVSFPGGKMDENETPIQGALRETEEEIGIPAKDITIWTEMSNVLGRNKDLVITPVVGFINNFDMNKLKPNIDEVAEIFTVPIQVFCDVNNHGHMTYNNTIIPVYDCGKHKVWGITGFITHLFLQSFLSPDAYDTDFLRKKYELDELMPSKL